MFAFVSIEQRLGPPLGNSKSIIFPTVGLREGGENGRNQSSRMRRRGYLDVKWTQKYAECRPKGMISVVEPRGSLLHDAIGIWFHSSSEAQVLKRISLTAAARTSCQDIKWAQGSSFR
jgi:hypothetical protein